jgi:hypothetical protein
MDQKAIVDAIEKQMDVLESIFNWIIIFTIPVFWAGLQRTNEMEALGMTFNLGQAYYVLAAAYFGISVQIYLSLHRIGDFLNLLDKENTPSGISKLLFHKWIFNPFIYTGDEKESRLHIFFGTGGLVAAWATGNAALSTLSDFQPRAAGYVSLGLLVFVGLTSVPAVVRVVLIILGKLYLIESRFFENYKATFRARRIGGFIGLLIGGIVIATIAIGNALRY